MGQDPVSSGIGKGNRKSSREKDDRFFSQTGREYFKINLKKLMRHKFSSSIFIFLVFLMTSSPLLAQVQNENKLDYGSDVIIDSDLDGLTDLGEKNIYKTDPQNPDTDSDGILDGAEIIGGTDALNNTSPSALRTIDTQETLVKNETPWGWYISRASGLMAYLLLWLVMFFGLAIRTPIVKNIFPPAFSYETHTWLSVQALILVFFHSGALLWDKYLRLKFLDLAVPFHSPIYANEITLGILGLYLMIILILTSYFRKFFSQKIWRAVHFLNILLFIIVTIHAFLLGTDLHSGTPRIIFFTLNIFLILLITINLAARLKASFSREQL